MRRILAGAILLAAANAGWPQTQAPDPQKPATQPQPPERRPLNLRLDDPGRFGVQSDPPADKNDSASGLPGLGGGKPGAPKRNLEKTDVFPKDTNPQY